MKQLGTHLVVDAWHSPAELLNDPECIRRSLIDAISAGGATLIDLCVHQFSPHGVTATATLAESHIAIHTWPELGYFAADLFFCGHGNPHKAIEILQTALQAKEMKLTELKRGFEPGMGVQDTATTNHHAQSLTQINFS
ncbi:MAG: adenosylmethionine decarboxylase [Okeania sp. SIO3I5]|uniref:adenosylmethionine decarboxylase n=1 Tax=Okeania sp. SIO3I5 TaxID=2607805 RepID=UPI0013B94E29|nr:adenosylmethionine decarboxylase [Okeania sp. SIO3I5]NEQ35466.1 adenosylmethionine decarboxylase [Okeania sp. SIO3I5]